MKSLLLLTCSKVCLQFSDVEIFVQYCGEKIKISKDENNYTTISLKNQRVPYKMTMLGGFTFSEEKKGQLNFRKYFTIDWHDDLAIPELIFCLQPDKIRRDYSKGQKIELGIENIRNYHVKYEDEITADFTLSGETGYNFSFSTGFSGSINKDADGTHSIKFKGVRADADEDGYRSESKFIISRSKYTDNLLLILQDNASVFLE
ncbi:hypothetical protein B6I21_00140 [candidate division KSB1 bacterium 4572_119]|nr:MAG: hypothetical protein B6I21_00140 [candidate division KSB1 bacterium 4572_119]